MRRKMQEVAPFQPEHNMSSPSQAGTWWFPVVVVWAVPVDGAGWQFGLSDILAAAEHPSEGWGL